MRSFFCIPLLCCLLFVSGCFGSSGSSSQDDPAAPAGSDTAGAAAQQNMVELPVGAPEARVIQLLGAPDDRESIEGGREFWRYTNKRASFVYVSNTGMGHTLVIGNYIRQPEAKSPGLPLMLTLVFDTNRKLVDFNFTQLSF